MQPFLQNGRGVREMSEEDSHLTHLSKIQTSRHRVEWGYRLLTLGGLAWLIWRSYAVVDAFYAAKGG